MMRAWNQQAPSGVANLEAAERLLLGFLIELAVIDPAVARMMAMMIEPDAFADEMLGLITATVFGMARRADKLDLVDVVGEMTIGRGACPSTVIDEIAASIQAFDSTFAPVTS